MKKTLTVILSVGLLTGCSSALEQQADETEIEIEQTSELIEAEVKTVAERMQLELEEVIENADQMVLTDGEEATVTEAILLPLGEGTYGDLYGYLEDSNYERIEEMRGVGDLVLLEEGTTVEVLDIDTYRAKVRVEETGEEGFLQAKYLKQSS